MSESSILFALAFVLAAVSCDVASAQSCAPATECGDVDGSGSVTATDSLGVLNRAVSLPVNLNCSCTSEDGGAPSQPVRTGQTTCYDAAGDAISCAGTGQDGETQLGTVRAFTDNGDGTITDGGTGLMWEKLSDDDSIHDRDAVYSWSDAIAVKIAALNAATFAGHDDWRLPNRFELETLLDLGTSLPATYAEFTAGCIAGCSVDACSCTQSSPYWTSTSYDFDLTTAWYVGFGGGGVSAQAKDVLGYVRAVRTTP